MSLEVLGFGLIIVAFVVGIAVAVTPRLSKDQEKRTEDDDQKA